MKISEIFTSLQGEGVNSGIPSLFIRFAGCNLMCGGVDGQLVKEGKATWHCDSEKLWNISLSPFDQSNFALDSIKARLTENRYIKNVIFTGGEPVLQADAISEIIVFLIEEFPDRSFQYEMETNGTVESDIYTAMDIVNCSPKLRNSGMPLERRYNPNVQKQLLSINKENNNVWWKFVVSSENDLIEICKVFGFLPLDHVLIMPAGATREEVERVTAEIWPFCVANGLRMTNRLQVIAFNTMTGV